MLGCATGTFPFTYLGVPVGANMNLKRNWEPVIEKFRSKLSIWKAKTLSFGGRLTLVKAVLNNLPTYYLSLFKAPIGVIETLERLRRNFLWGGDEESRKIHWVAWDTVLASKDDGGLGISSLKAQNCALLMKWWWKSKTDLSSLWCTAVRSIHNLKRKPFHILAKKSLPGVWLNISRAADSFNLNPFDCFTIITGNGRNTLFWKDRWLGNDSLQSMFPTLYGLESRKSCLISDRCAATSGCWAWKNGTLSPVAAGELVSLNALLVDVSFSGNEDRLKFNLSADGGFTVEAMRLFLDAYSSAPTAAHKICWTKLVPLKVSCFVWRTNLGRIPTAESLLTRGVHVSSHDCAFCSEVSESANHLLASCSFARGIIVRIFSWCGIMSQGFNSINEVTDYAARWGNCPRKRKRFTAICYCTLWCLWMARNNKLFKGIPPSTCGVVDNVISLSYTWVRYRGKGGTVRWVDWVINPLGC